MKQVVWGNGLVVETQVQSSEAAFFWDRGRPARNEREARTTASLALDVGNWTPDVTTFEVDLQIHVLPNRLFAALIAVATPALPVMS